VFGENGTVVTDNINLYLQWVPTYTVSFNLNGGSGTIPASIAGVIPGSTLLESQMPLAGGFTKNGYINAGKWYSNAGTRNITVAMTDSYGDGWNKAALKIKVNGTNLSTNPTISLNNSSNSYSFNANSGDVVEFYWIKGDNDEECAFSAYYSNNISQILLSKQYDNLNSVSNEALLGSFTVPPPEEFVFGEGGTVVTDNTTLYLKWTNSNTPILNRENLAIFVQNPPLNTKIELYNLQGKRIYSAYPENPSILRIGVQTGIYIVKIGTQTMRVAVR